MPLTDLFYDNKLLYCFGYGFFGWQTKAILVLIFTICDQILWGHSECKLNEHTEKGICAHIVEASYGFWYLLVFVLRKSCNFITVKWFILLVKTIDLRNLLEVRRLTEDVCRKR